MLVEDVMTAEVVTVPIDDTLADAAARILEADVGSVIVERGGDPTGIVTKSDVLWAAHRTGEPLGAILVESAMSHPLETIAPGATVRAAARRMGEGGIKRLAVTDGIDLVGIVTQSDVVRNHASILREAIHHEERRERFERDEDVG